MGSIVLGPLIYSALFMGSKIESVNVGLSMVNLMPLVSVEIISIYFFRIVLVNYKSVKAQVLQIELRKTLCRFIADYSDFSNEIKEKDTTALEKFENLIFSGIVSNEDKLPSTFDGVEQLNRVIGLLKK